MTVTVFRLCFHFLQLRPYNILPAIQHRCLTRKRNAQRAINSATKRMQTDIVALAYSNLFTEVQTWLQEKTRSEMSLFPSQLLGYSTLKRFETNTN